MFAEYQDSMINMPWAAQPTARKCFDIIKPAENPGSLLSSPGLPHLAFWSPWKYALAGVALKAGPCPQLSQPGLLER